MATRVCDGGVGREQVARPADRHRHPLNAARGIAVAGVLSTLAWGIAAFIAFG